MMRIPGWLGVVVAAFLALSGLGAAAIARQTLSQAETTQQGAARLRETRLGLVEAQNALGDTNLEDAVAGAEGANEAALEVKASTALLLQRLRGLAEDVEQLTSTSASSGQSLELTRERMHLATQLLEAVRSEQQAASDATSYTTRSLRRILTALRETNRSFP